MLYGQFSVLRRLIWKKQDCNFTVLTTTINLKPYHDETSSNPESRAGNKRA